MNKYLKFCRKAAADGMVLLKNDRSVLPIDKSNKVALFGRGQFVTIKSGSGSGDVVGVKTVNAVEGFENAYVQLCEELLDYNLKWHNDHIEDVKNTDKFYPANLHNLNEIPLTENIVRSAAEETETAVVILSRIIGEGVDIELSKGEFYLSDKEAAMLKLVRENFKNMVVCLNFGGVYDLSGVMKYSPDALLYMSQGGQQVGNALVDVLTGVVVPSGKLTDTWAKNYTDYPTTQKFGEMKVPYCEGVYVGYRYFDTFNVTPLFEFGFGLSYTDFSIKDVKTELNGSEFTVTAEVKNIGEYKGREVVQCYFSKPDGKIEQPYQELVAFAKTKELSSGECQTVELKFDFKDNATYCTETASFVLPEGEYYVRLGNSSRNTHIVATVCLENEITVLKTVNRFKPNTEFLEISKKGIKPFTYYGEEKEKKEAQKLILDGNCIKCVTVERAENNKPKLLKVKPENQNKTITITDVANGEYSAEDLVAQFNLDELGCIINGINYGQDTFEGGIIGSMANSVPGAAGETFTIPKYNLTGNVCADGPAGIRLLSSGDDFTKIADDDERRTLTAYPIGTCFANSWDYDLAVEYGKCIREELARFNIDGWLAPGMNIHRNPLCGRNFEYFSEDPLISGKMAAAQTVGVQIENGEDTGFYTTVKHFIANEQETFRTEMSSEVTERTLREIYLKPFEIAVKESQPHALMTSYNKINGVYATVNYDLLNGVLRSEWGFKGLVMSDWGASGELAERAYCGNDLNMPGSAVRNIELLKNGKTDIAAAQEAAVRVINLIVKTTELRKQKNQ